MIRPKLNASQIPTLDSLHLKLKSFHIDGRHRKGFVWRNDLKSLEPGDFLQYADDIGNERHYTPVDVEVLEGTHVRERGEEKKQVLAVSIEGTSEGKLSKITELGEGCSE